MQRVRMIKQLWQMSVNLLAIVSAIIFVATVVLWIWCRDESQGFIRQNATNADGTAGTEMRLELCEGWVEFYKYELYDTGGAFSGGAFPADGHWIRADSTSYPFVVSPAFGIQANAKLYRFPGLVVQIARDEDPGGPLRRSNLLIVASLLWLPTLHSLFAAMLGEEPSPAIRNPSQRHIIKEDRRLHCALKSYGTSVVTGTFNDNVCSSRRSSMSKMLLVLDTKPSSAACR
jgi:hypothetical protein